MKFRTIFVVIWIRGLLIDLIGINSIIYAQNFTMFVNGGKKKGFQPIGKKGENICNNKLVNIFAEHKDCICAVV